MPAQLHRKVRRDFEHGDLRAFKTRSFTLGVEAEYHPTIDLVTLEYHCDCKDHQFRHRFCKHLRRAAANCIRKGELDPHYFQYVGVKGCVHCGSSEDLRPLALDNGQHVDGQHICWPCIESLNK